MFRSGNFPLQLFQFGVSKNLNIHKLFRVPIGTDSMELHLFYLMVIPYFHSLSVLIIFVYGPFLDIQIVYSSFV